MSSRLRRRLRSSAGRRHHRPQEYRVVPKTDSNQEKSLSAHSQNWNLFSKDSAKNLNFVIGSERFVTVSGTFLNLSRSRRTTKDACIPAGTGRKASGGLTGFSQPRSSTPGVIQLAFLRSLFYENTEFHTLLF